MTVLALTLPLARRSAIHHPRRDILAETGSDLTLRLTLVESDRPDAAPLSMMGIGPVLRLLVYRDPDGVHGRWDYGPCWVTPHRQLLWSGLGVAAPSVAGRVDVTIPRGTLGGHGPRLVWLAQLEYQGGQSTVASGILSLRYSPASSTGDRDLLTDQSDPVLTDDSVNIEV